MALANYVFTLILDVDGAGNSNVGKNVPIEIRNADAEAALATIYSDADGLLSPISQPGATTNELGKLSFWAERGLYQVYVNGQANDIIPINGYVEAETLNSSLVAQRVEELGIQGEQTIEAGVKQAVQNTGYFPVSGSFEDGGTITDYSQVLLLQNADGSNGAGYYSWGGTLPKTAAAASTPSTTGGIGETAWVYRADAALRSDLSGLQSDTQVAGQEAQALRRVPSYHYEQMGIAFRSDVDAPVTDRSGMWPHGNLAYDEEDDKFIVAYNVTAGHNINQCRTLIRKKDPEGGFSDAIVVADRIAQGESMKCQSFGIAPNGDYLALIGVRSTSGVDLRTSLYRSADKGATWSGSDLLVDGSQVVAYNGDVTGFLKLSSGRILTWYDDDIDRSVNIIYSDNSGFTWSNATVSGSPTDVTEPAWVELPDGVIVCLARASVVSGNVSQKIPAKFLKSEDGGLTWSAPVDSQSIANFTLSNGELIYHDDTETVEFIHHSRYVEEDGNSSLMVSTATVKDAKEDNFSQQVRVGQLAGAIALRGNEGDSGYVSAKKSASGVINVFYYNGVRSGAQINWAIGRKSGGNDRQYNIDETSGLVKNPDSSMTFMYHRGHEASTEVGGAWHKSPLTTDRFVKRESNIYMSLTDGGVSQMEHLGAINPVDMQKIMVSGYGFNFDEDSEFAIRLYDTDSPNSVDDGLVRKAATTKTGHFTVYMDVTDLAGVHFIMPTLYSANSSSNAAVEIHTIAVAGVNFFSQTRPYDTGVSNDFYVRGNECQYFTGGWSIGYTQGVETISKEPDHISIQADGSTSESRAQYRTGAIDFTDLQSIEVLADVTITNSTASEFAIAAYSVQSPSTATDGREKIIATKEEGIIRLPLDVRGLTGVHYLHVACFANLNNAESGVTTAKVLNVYAK